MRYLLLFVVACVAVACVHAQGGEWVGSSLTVDDYYGPPIANRNPTVVVVGEHRKMLLFGGRYILYRVWDNNAVMEFDLDTGNWTEIRGDNTSVPPQLGYRSAAVYVPKYDLVYTFGGMYSGESVPYSDEFYAYNITSRTFTPMSATNPPPARCAHTLVYADATDSLIMFGGYLSSGSIVNELWHYFFANNTWVKQTPTGTTVAPFRACHSATWVPSLNKLVVFGGGVDDWVSPQFYNDVFEYSTITNQWTKLLDVVNRPSGRGDMVSMFYPNQNVIVYHGGETVVRNPPDINQFVDDLLVYDINSHTFHNASSNKVRRGRHGGGLDTTTGSFYFFGGMDDVIYDSDNFALWYEKNDVWRFNLQVPATTGGLAISTSSSASDPVKSDDDDDGGSSAALGIGLGLGLGFPIVCGAIVAVFFLRKRKRDELNGHNSAPIIATSITTSSDANTYASVDARQSTRASTVFVPIGPGGAPQQPKAEPDFPRVDNVQIKNKLGEGNFGAVYYGLWNDVPVALKQLTDSEDLVNFKREATNLKNLSHPNVVQFLGIYIDQKGSQYLVTEFLSRGSLLETLRTEAQTLTLLDLFIMATEAAKGMVYLESKNVLHRDLATRNLLVTKVEDRYVVKISDFGMSRATNEYKPSTASVPFRWSAPETLRFGHSSSKSDVFSFGVVLWEILELGARPYNWIADNDSVAKAVLDGQRLPQPKSCPDALFALMQRCWDAVPEQRPSFSEILEQLQAIKKQLALEHSDLLGQQALTLVTKGYVPNPQNSSATQDTYQSMQNLSESSQQNEGDEGTAHFNASRSNPKFDPQARYSVQYADIS